MARSTAFNRYSVTTFFRNLEEADRKIKVSHFHFYNLDQMGMTTCPQSSKSSCAERIKADTRSPAPLLSSDANSAASTSAAPQLWASASAAPQSSTRIPAAPQFSASTLATPT
ncbi:hypothetical protein PoB_000963600 [Plakobranchus ocellatus]|uniref:Uncharacterized protein n=1 Tax=Plakobranchus ocellatus TaxID=259542 RepID=A0AAV3YIR4_9GAST|nr:hypothetical protein PoB_000963600 [Plakobranchus ocellatus]